MDINFRPLSVSTAFMLFVITALLLASNARMSAQGYSSLNEQKGFMFDALCFKGKADTLQRLDVFVVVPYQHLRFEKKGESYLAQYSLQILVEDSQGRKVKEKTQKRVRKETEYSATVGAGSEFDYTQHVFALAPADYHIEVRVRDLLAQKENVRKRNVAVLDFHEFPFALSSIMIASAIEQRGARFAVTPHVTDDVTVLISDGFFAFFESYNSSPLITAFDAVTQLVDSRGATISQSSPSRLQTAQEQRQQFVKVELPSDLGPGSYTLKLIALRTDASADEIREKDILAVSERTVRVEWSAQFGPIGEENLWKAIRQLRYAATQTEIDKIESSTTAEKRRNAFFDFWKSKDPTPNTLRNEAYEEFYARIEYANQNYRSYTEGWLSDMGRVFIIFGTPQDVRRQDNRADGKIIERWVFSGNREFVFVDFSGFGDFRLSTALSPGEKYVYGR